ncbi:gp53-like domain-containing protein [Achromobacter mucicolens]|uniref:gp53-like domain-containing protein n=1 Tax=Achromobacter mucicolens TaxID=1389922 RepID=UPI00289C1C4F|nr:hypothetical protein [Achromobacter mucicolens]
MDYPKSVPGVGLVAGRFVDEDPIAGRAGSLIPAGWGNAVTDSILAVQARAGFEPNEGDPAQLRDAIEWMIRNFSASEAQAGTAKVASTTQAQAMTDDSVLLTPKKLADALKGANQSFGANSFQVLPGGLILQFGKVTASTTSTDYRTFPKAFPTGALAGMAGYGAWSQNGAGCGFEAVSPSQFLVSNYNTAQLPQPGQTWWIALGR